MKKIILMLILLSTSSHASDWKWVADNNTDRIMNIKCLENICYALSGRTEGPVVLKSYDYGESWEEVYSIGTDWDTHSPEFLDVVDTNHLFIRFRDEKSSILKSVDGGYNFKKIKIDTEKDVWIRSLRMFTKNFGYATATFDIYVTHDGWETNTRTSFNVLMGISQFFEPQIKDEESIYYISHGLFAELNINTLDTTTLFAPIELTTVEYPNAYVLDIEIINDTLGFFVGERLTGIGNTKSDLIFRTKGSLTDWELQFDNIPDPDYPWGLGEISFYDEFNGVAAGRHGKLYFTNDGGNSWHYQSMKQQLDDLGDPGFSACLAWSDTMPLLGTNFGFIFRYEGDFFDFSRKPRIYPPIFPLNECGKWEQLYDITLSWDLVENAKYYRLEIDDAETFMTPVYIADSLTSTEILLPLMQSGVDHYWRVKSYNDEAISKWSDLCHFSTSIIKPKLISPKDRAVLNENDVEFIWEPNQKAINEYSEDFYRLQIAEDKKFENIIFKVENIEDFKFYYSDLEPGKFYYWRVQGYNENFTNNWSRSHRLYTQLQSVELINPENKKEIDDDQATLEWSESQNAIRYIVELSYTEDFDDIARIDSVSKLTRTFYYLNENTNYFWRVKAVNDIMRSDWSETRSFYTGTTSVWSGNIKGIRLKPNPAQNKIMIEGLDNVQSVQYRIIDLSGNPILSGQINSQTIELDISSLSSGAYFFVIGDRRIKFVKM